MTTTTTTNDDNYDKNEDYEQRRGLDTNNDDENYNNYEDYSINMTKERSCTIRKTQYYYYLGSKTGHVTFSCGMRKLNDRKWCTRSQQICLEKVGKRKLNLPLCK